MTAENNWGYIFYRRKQLNDRVKDEQGQLWDCVKAQWYDKGISHTTHGEALLRKIDSRLTDIAVHVRTRQRKDSFDRVITSQKVSVQHIKKLVCWIFLSLTLAQDLFSRVISIVDHSRI